MSRGDFCQIYFRGVQTQLKWCINCSGYGTKETWMNAQSNDNSINFAVVSSISRISGVKDVILRLMTAYWRLRWNQIQAKQFERGTKQLAVTKSTVLDHLKQIGKWQELNENQRNGR